MANDPGTNACIARTPAGKQLLDEAIAAGYLVSESTASLQDLSDWQPHQVSKKHLCEARFAGLRKAGHLGIETVNLATAELDSELDPADRMREIDGTIRRITIGKHRDDYG